MMTISHVLPGETGGDVTWFARLNAFEQQETLRQVRFKRTHWPGLENGRYAKLPQHTYPLILPKGHLDKAFYPPIAGAILDHLKKEEIALHAEAHHLRSSQVACLNFLFPLHEDLALASAIFRSLIPGLQAVTNIEFEHTGPKKAQAEVTRWLGEPPNGKRGQNRTSIDAAIFWTDTASQQRATLVEWKYTERNYGVCSAYSRASKAEKARCEGLNVWENPNPAEQCLLCVGLPARRRRYWEHMGSAGIVLKAFQGARGCPFQGPFYQLMRQFMLAAYLRQAGVVDQAEVLSLSFAGNTSLETLPTQLRPLGENSLLRAWNKTLRANAPPLLHLTAEALAQAIGQAEEADPAWRAYLKERYGI